MNENNLTRFLDAQNQTYLRALSEIRAGEKQSHWMWFVFPQLKGLGKSGTANFYGINGIAEAEEFLHHPVLGKNLLEISEAVLEQNGKTVTEILGKPDDMKLRSSMTLFANVPDAPNTFQKVLDKYFKGSHDELTVQLLLKERFANDAI